MTTKKPIGYAKYLLAVDCETTGLCYHSSSPVKNSKTKEHHQAISWGIIVADSSTLKPVEELYLEIKWNDISKKQKAKDPLFGRNATKIHGLTQQHLDKNGISEDQAVAQIGELILKYWGPKSCIKCLGHNVQSFDVPFLNDMFERFNIKLNFGNRHYDSNSIGFATVNSWNSNDLFETLGLNNRTQHNALEDAKLSLESFRRIKTLWEKFVGVTVDE